MIIPSSVTSLGWDGYDFDVGGGEIFYNCGNLYSITVDASNTEFSSQNGVLYNKYQTALIKYPQAKADT